MDCESIMRRRQFVNDVYELLQNFRLSDAYPNANGITH
jgi:hypothetical protein